ncbi:MAG: YceI family protein [Saprospiraceae bacterium]|nr:MAG: YceI family protein [Saprospiraceae bacterium]
MKKVSFYLLLLSVFALTAMSFTANYGGRTAVTYKVDTAASQVGWKGYKVTGEHAGTIKVKNGNIQFEDGKFTGGSFEIDMNTITPTGMSEGMQKKLEGHLKSDDFFGAAKFPVSTFVITKVVSRGTPGSYKITGNITIKETTKEIKFDATVNEHEGQVTAEANIRLDRSEFNVRYGSGSFFDNLGDKTIYDEFDLNIKLVAHR